MMSGKIVLAADMVENYSGWINMQDTDFWSIFNLFKINGFDYPYVNISVEIWSVLVGIYLFSVDPSDVAIMKNVYVVQAEYK